MRISELLTEDQIRSTLRDLAGQKVKQAFVHPRPGLMTRRLRSQNRDHHSPFSSHASASAFGDRSISFCNSASQASWLSSWSMCRQTRTRCEVDGFRLMYFQPLNGVSA